MRLLFFLSLLLLSSNLFAYTDMSQQVSRAAELGMQTKDYAFSMSIAGLLSGTMFGLFLWKAK